MKFEDRVRKIVSDDILQLFQDSPQTIPDMSECCRKIMAKLEQMDQTLQEVDEQTKDIQPQQPVVIPGDKEKKIVPPKRNWITRGLDHMTKEYLNNLPDPRDDNSIVSAISAWIGDTLSDLVPLPENWEEYREPINDAEYWRKTVYWLLRNLGPIDEAEDVLDPLLPQVLPSSFVQPAILERSGNIHDVLLMMGKCCEVISNIAEEIGDLPSVEDTELLFQKYSGSFSKLPPSSGGDTGSLPPWIGSIPKIDRIRLRYPTASDSGSTVTPPTIPFPPPTIWWIWEFLHINLPGGEPEDSPSRIPLDGEWAYPKPNKGEGDGDYIGWSIEKPGTVLSPVDMHYDDFDYTPSEEIQTLANLDYVNGLGHGIMGDGSTYNDDKDWTGMTYGEPIVQSYDWHIGGIATYDRENESFVAYDEWGFPHYIDAGYFYDTKPQFIPEDSGTYTYNEYDVDIDAILENANEDYDSGDVGSEIDDYGYDEASGNVFSDAIDDYSFDGDWNDVVGDF